MEEQAGRVSEAADILQEVQVETIGAMKIREKCDFLLEQTRLCLAKKDFIRAEIISKKVNVKSFENEELQDLKLKYYNLMIQLHRHHGDYLSTCRSFKAIYDTPLVQGNPAQWRDALKNVVIFLVLAPFDSEVSDILHRLKLDKKVAEMPTLKLVLDLFTTNELIAWPLHADAEWRSDSIFANSDDGRKRYDDLHKRVVQFNIRVISKYYHRITTARLAGLLKLSNDTAEEYLSELVSSKQLFAKVDRPAGIVTVTRKETANSLLNAWSNDISQLLAVVEKTTHLINKEYMVKENLVVSD
jgi:26S proteasome regulatory subunit N5